ISSHSKRSCPFRGCEENTQAEMARLVFVLSFLLFLLSGAMAATFTLTNNCEYTVWPGVLSSAGTAPLSITGFALQQGESRSLDV
ncbi:unnamed protein product, partial [Musa hybrid cultivar]